MEQENRKFPEIETDGVEKPTGWVKWAAVPGLAALLVGGFGAAGAMSGEFGGPGMGRHMMNANMGGQMGGRMGGMGFAGHGFGRMLDQIDATAEQETRIWAIVDGARGELRPMMREFRDARGDVIKILGAETIDRAAAETLRAERIAAMDEASKKMTAALLDAAEVLTPEQRAKLVENFQERGPGRRW